jgi:hypothetical protein
MLTCYRLTLLIIFEKADDDTLSWLAILANETQYSSTI